jgi:N-acetylmuramoyl-L-alanine amidase
MSKICVIVDAGHGGNDPVTGKYMTPPQWGKFYRFLKPDGTLDFEIREGVINRIIANLFCEMLTKAGVDFEKIYHPYEDTPLMTLCQKANSIHYKKTAEGKKCVLFSFHSNAFGATSQGVGESPQGFSVWTTRGVTVSDQIARIWFEEHKRVVGNLITYRIDMSDGDVDWEENFTIIYGTSMPAVLAENLFFTNPADAFLLRSKSYQEQSARAALNAILRIEKEISF